MRNGFVLGAFAIVTAVFVASCGGGGGSSGGGGQIGFTPPGPQITAPVTTPTPAITATPAPPATSTSSVSVGTSVQTLALTTIAAGYSAAITVSATTSGTGTLNGTLSSSLPSGAPAISSTSRVTKAIGVALTPVIYVAVTMNATVTFPVTPAFTIFLPSGLSIPAGSQFYFGLFDPTQAASGWQTFAGPGTVSQGTVTFNTSARPLTLTAGQTYIFGLFTTASSALTTPTPKPTPTPTPAPTATATPTPIAGQLACLTGSSASRSTMSVRSGRKARGFKRSTVNPNRLYVTYRASAASRAWQSIDRSVNASRVVDLGIQQGVGHRLISLSGISSAAATAQLRQNADVLDVAPTHFRYTSAVIPSTCDVANDPLSDPVDQWYLYATNTTPGGWRASTGSSAMAIAIIDTGVDLTNPDFIVDFQESIINGSISTTAGAAQDGNGHGTNTAGLAAAQTSNGIGFAGVGFHTHLQAYKIFPDPSQADPDPGADTGDEALAITDAVTHGAAVISMSLGSPDGPDPVEKAAITAALAANVIVVAANGNEFGDGTPDGNQSDFPAAYPGVIAVGASALADGGTAPGNLASITAETIAQYSNSGPMLVAPGGDALNDSQAGAPDLLHWIVGYSTTTASLAEDQCSPFNVAGTPICAVLFNGTSQATPQVAGAVALMLAKHGSARTLTPAQVGAILTTTVDVLPGIDPTRQGAGRINVGKALAATH